MIKQIRTWFKKPNKSALEEFIESIIIVVPIAFLIRTVGYGLYQVPSESMETTMLVGERFLADKFTILFRSVERGEIISFNDPTYQYSSHTLVNWWQQYVWGPSNWTKRVIGIPGDRVQGRIENGKPVVYLNGQKLDEPYVNRYPLIYVWKNSVPTVQDIYLGNYDMSLRSFDPAYSYDKQPFYKIDARLVYDPKNAANHGDFVYDDVHRRALNYPEVPLANGRDVFDVQLGKNEYWAMGDNRKGSYDSRGWGKLPGRLIHGKIKYRLLSIDSDESWLIIDLLKHPINFWKKVRWSRCFQAIH